jgi:hypothetical protein
LLCHGSNLSIGKTKITSLKESCMTVRTPVDFTSFGAVFTGLSIVYWPLAAGRMFLALVKMVVYQLNGRYGDRGVGKVCSLRHHDYLNPLTVGNTQAIRGHLLVFDGV